MDSFAKLIHDARERLAAAEAEAAKWRLFLDGAEILAGPLPPYTPPTGAVIPSKEPSHNWAFRRFHGGSTGGASPNPDHIGGCDAPKMPTWLMDVRGKPAEFAVAGRGQKVAATEDFVLTVIHRYGRPVTVPEILKEAAAASFEIGGKDPGATLGARLHRSYSLKFLKGVGWAPHKPDASDEPQPMASEQPESVAEAPPPRKKRAGLFGDEDDDSEDENPDLEYDPAAAGWPPRS